MIDITSEKSIIESLISNVLGESFTIYLNKLIVLSVYSDDYICEIEFLKDSSNLPIISIYEKESKSLGYWRDRENFDYWEVENFSWEETFNRLHYYIDYYANLLKDFYNVSVDQLDGYGFYRTSKYVNLKKLGKGSTIAYKFRKKF